MLALAPHPAENLGKPLSLRAQARATGISYSTVRRRSLMAAAGVLPTQDEKVADQARREGITRASVRDRRLAAAARAASAPAATDLASVVTQLAASQAQTATLLRRMLDGESGKEVLSPQADKPKSQPKPEKPDKPLEGGTLEEPEACERRVYVRRAILTSAQNNTLPHPALQTLERMAHAIGATIFIAKNHYNKNAWNNAAGVTRQSAEVFFNPAVVPYLVDGPIRLADDLVFAAEVDRLPTAGDPLAGLGSYTQDSSGVFGHPKVAMRSMPRLPGEDPRFLFSTGSVTQRNYVDRLGGKKAAFHHVFGALLVEIDEDGTWFARQLVATEAGEIHDLDTVYTPHGSRKEDPDLVVFGDVHRRFLTDTVREACWGSTGILRTLQCKSQVLHDVHHFVGRSHHAIKDPFALAEFARTGDDSVENEVAGDAAFLQSATSPGVQTIVANANHHRHLARWITEADFRMDPKNARYGHWLAYNRHVAIEAGQGSGFDTYAFAVTEKTGPLQGTRFLKQDEAFKVHGIELSLHGDQGSNGGRGSPNTFNAYGRKTITADAHTPGIWEGNWRVGTCAMSQGYNKGMGGWALVHCLIYPNGKRTMLIMRGSRWRGTPVSKPRYRVQAGRAAA